MAALGRAPDVNDVSGRLAIDLLSQRNAPRYLESVEKLLSKNGYSLGDPLGAGSESMVFGSGDNVIKIGRDRFAQGPFALPAVPGVNPYVLSELVGPYRVGVQPRAMEVASADAIAADPTGDLLRLWRGRADVVSDSLNRRGYNFDDARWPNVGVMPDNTLAAIDGFITPGAKPMPRVLSLFPTAEDSIRALLVAPPR